MVMGRNKNLMDWHGEPMRYEFGGSASYLPLHYHDSDSFTAIYPADFEAVAAALPSEAITPLRWLDGRALLLIAAFRWRRITWSGPDGSSGQLEPYGEVGVAAFTCMGRVPRVLPMLLGPASSVFLQLPVTTREARDGGRHIFGMPKFLADMDFTESPGLRTVRVSEQGDDILTLTVHVSGRFRSRTQPTVGHLAVNGDLREYVAPSFGYTQLHFDANGAKVELGTHAVAQQIRDLGIADRPVAVMNTLRTSMILPPPGQRLGPARDVPCYPGRDDDYARYTLTYPGAEPIDVHPSRQHV
jgi:hypothetical protein